LVTLSHHNIGDAAVAPVRAAIFVFHLQNQNHDLECKANIRCHTAEHI